MMHKIGLWFKCWHAIFMWRYMAEVLLLKMENESPEVRAVYIEELRRNQERIGHCVLTILGVYPLEDWF